MAGELNNWELRAIAISVTVPDAAWRVTIEELYLVNGEIWAISRVSRPPVMAAQVISAAKDQVSVRAPAGNVRHFVLGKTWNWDGGDGCAFVASKAELPAAIHAGMRLYPSDAAGK